MLHFHLKFLERQIANFQKNNEILFHLIMYDLPFETIKMT
jgi:hypothetical protein